MGYKQQVRQQVERLTGTRIYRCVPGTRIYRGLPRGIDRFTDISIYLPKLKVHIIFDVGANVGQSARHYLETYRDCEIYCFEPVDFTYRELERQLNGYDNIRTFKFGFSAEKERGLMILDEASDMSFLRKDTDNIAPECEASVEHVELETIDDFCKDQRIEQINYLKIDTEGNDLDVLRGAECMLNGQRIDLVEVETGMNRGNTRHVPFGAIASFMEEHDYFLFGIYEQTGEWPTNLPNLRRTNPIFISNCVMMTNKDCPRF